MQMGCVESVYESKNGALRENKMTEYMKWHRTKTTNE